MTHHIEPLAAEARPVRSRGHRVKHDSRMLDRPQRPVGAAATVTTAATNRVRVRMLGICRQGRTSMTASRAGKRALLKTAIRRPQPAAPTFTSKGHSAVRALRCLLLVRECLCHILYPR